MAGDTIAQTLRARRKYLNLTQQEAADLAGVSRTFVHESEAGKSGIQLDKLQTLANALGLTLTLQLRTRHEEQP